MGKYGNGLAIADHIRLDRKEIRTVLDRNGIEGEDRKAIVDAFEEAAYQWCSANSYACVLEETIKKIFEKNPDKQEPILTAILIGKLAGIKLKETYPAPEEGDSE